MSMCPGRYAINKNQICCNGMFKKSQVLKVLYVHVGVLALWSGRSDQLVNL